MPKIEKRVGLGGGSEGEFAERSGHPFFYPDVSGLKLLTRNVYDVRILPAYDFSIPVDDPAFATSFVPYRDINAPVNTETGHPQFTKFYFVAKGYEFVGSERRGFLSPLSQYKRAERGFDPMYDTWLTAKNHSNPEFQALTKKPANVRGEFNAQLEAPRGFVFLNVLVNINGNMENRIAVLRSKALGMLKETLDYPRPAAVKEIITPDWPDFLYGDVTDPLTGLLGTVKRTGFGDAGMETAAFHFSSKSKRLDGVRPYSFDPNTEIGRSILAGRQNIPDLGKVTRIATADEILEFIVNDGFLPYELIQEACENNWTMPSKPVGRSYSTPGQEPEDAGGEDSNMLAQPPVANGHPASGAVSGRVAAPSAARPGAVARPAAVTTRPTAVRPAATPTAAARPAAVTTRPTAVRPAATPTAAARPAAVTTRPTAVRPAATPTAAARPAVSAARTLAPEPSPAALASNEESEEAAAGLAPSEAAPVAPLTAEEVAWYNQAADQFEKDPQSLSPEDVVLFVELQDRVSALAANGG